MQQTLDRVAEQISEKWKQMSRADKLKLGLIVLFSLAALGIAVFMFTKANYVRLTDNNVSMKQISEIKSVLESNAISYTLSDDGGAILVNQKDLGKARIAISTENISGSVYSFDDMLKENMMGLTDTEKNFRYKKLKEEELIEAIKKIDGVSDAVVKLTIPEQSPFVTDEKAESKAGIQLSLAKPLSKKQVLGIAKFVSSSVENLSLANISISDTTPAVLYSGDDSSDTSGYGNLSKEEEIRATKTADIKDKVTALLSPKFDKVIVTPNLKINFDKYKETNEKVSSPFDDGKKGIPITEQTEKTSSESTPNSQAPGYDSNSDTGTPDYYTGNSNTSKSGTERSNTTYAVNKTVSELEKATGDTLLNESSLSVMVYTNQVYDYAEVKKQGLLDKTTWNDFKAKTKSDAMVKKLTIDNDIIELIQKGTGISDVKITGGETPVFIDEKPFKFDIEGYIPVILMVVFISFIAFILTRKSKETGLSRMEPELSVEHMLASTKANQRMNEELLPELQEHNSETRKRIEDFIENKPQLVAQLLKNWIAEDWE